MRRNIARTLSERENYLRVLEYRNPEWIPVQFDLSDSTWMAYGDALEAVVLRHPRVFPGYQKGSYPREPQDRFYRAYDDLVDDWGCVWKNTQPGILGQVVGHLLADWKAFEHFRPPDPHQQFDWRAIREQVETDRREGRLRRGFISITQGGFFDRLQFLRGMENLMMDFATHPPQLSSLIEMVLEYNLAYDRLWLDMGLDEYCYHGDIGGQKSLLFSPATFRRYIKPAYTELFAACHRAGAHVSYSSDGRLVPLVDDLIECGVNLHDPQLGPNTLDEIVGAYKGKLCAKVDVDEQLLPFAAPEQLRELIRNVVDTLWDPKGGFMLYIGCYHDTPLETIEILCQTLEEYCF